MNIQGMAGWLIAKKNLNSNFKLFTVFSLLLAIISENLCKKSFSFTLQFKKL